LTTKGTEITESIIFFCHELLKGAKGQRGRDAKVQSFFRKGKQVMDEEKINKINSVDQKIIEKLQDQLGGKIEPVSEIGPFQEGYTINQAGAVVGLGLYRFNLDDKKLQTVVDILVSLGNLTQLNLGANQLTDISGLGQLTNLMQLYLLHNQLTDISGLGKLDNLAQLDLTYNQLTDISVLGQLSNLTLLYLGGNQLTDISVLGQLSNLTLLALGGNQLTDISVLGQLTNLTELDLRNNKIKELPEWITELGMEIYCDHNYYEKGINLYDNLLETPPVEIVKQEGGSELF